MTSPRIPPLAPPYAPPVAAALAAMMPAESDIEPLAMFRTFAHHLPMADAMQALGSFILGRTGRALGSRDREIVILRACARAGCEYEWGVHAVAFGARVGLDERQISASVAGDAADPAWSEQDALLIRLVDELHERAQVSDELWTALAAHWSVPQLLELLLVAGWYRTISYLANGVRVTPEAWARRW